MGTHPMADTETKTRTPDSATPPDGASAVLVLGSGETIWGRGIGATGTTTGEVCFNTSITGYQEILTDPSYAGQIITFTFPHIGNVGANPEDIETTTPASRGLIIRGDITHPSNWRAAQHLDDVAQIKQPDRPRRCRHAPPDPADPRCGRADRRDPPRARWPF